MTQPEKMVQEIESLMKERRSGSTTAEGVALLRAWETIKPEGERICCDPYAIRFIRPEILARMASRTPEQQEEDRVHHERHFPGHRNSIPTRVRFFDEIVLKELAGGLSQLVLIGAGYDTRAYRLEGMEKARVFEVDVEETQAVKKDTVIRIFGALPRHVSYIPLDLAKGGFLSSLSAAGFDRTRRALFVMEGLLCYLPPALVRQLLGTIAGEMAPGSSVLFDCYPQSMVDGTHPLAVAKNIRKHVESIGEPFLFGIPDDGVELFLGDLGYHNVTHTTDREYLRTLFPADSSGRDATGLLSFCHAEVGAE